MSRQKIGCGFPLSFFERKNNDNKAYYCYSEIPNFLNYSQIARRAAPTLTPLFLYKRNAIA